MIDSIKQHGTKLMLSLAVVWPFIQAHAADWVTALHLAPVDALHISSGIAGIGIAIEIWKQVTANAVG